MFERERNKLQEDIEGYRTLCSQYVALIQDLKNKPDRTSEEGEILSIAYMDYGRLASLAT